MKNLKSIQSQIFSVIVMLLLVSQLSYAQETKENLAETSPVSIYVATNGQLKVAIDNPDVLKYKISIVDKVQKVWFEESTNKKVYRKTFDFNQILPSVYEVQVTTSDKSYKFKLEKADEVKYSLVPIS